MSNIFKQNSRFAALVEDKDNKKDNKKKEVQFNSFKNKDRSRPYEDKEKFKLNKEREYEEKKRRELKEKERIRQESLNLDNFPSLSLKENTENTENTENSVNKLSYLDKIKANNGEKEKNKYNNIDPDLVNLKPGWVLLKRDPKTNGTIMKTHPSYSLNLEDDISEAEIGRDILKALADLHEKRTQEYINMYGYDTWEKMFKRPHWREEELENMTDSDEDEDEEYEDDEEYQEDEYEVYWK